MVICTALKAKILQTTFVVLVLTISIVMLILGGATPTLAHHGSYHYNQHNAEFRLVLCRGVGPQRVLDSLRRHRGSHQEIGLLV